MGVPAREAIGDDERVDLGDGVGEVDAAQQARAVAVPTLPSAADVALHNLTHLPYRSWCQWCVAGCKNNTPHLTQPTFSRDIPLLVADYCFVWDRHDQDLLTILVARLYPSRAIVAIPNDTKGPDVYATSHLAAFLKASGVDKLVYMCDQENALRTMYDRFQSHNVEPHWHKPRGCT